MVIESVAGCSRWDCLVSYVFHSLRFRKSIVSVTLSLCRFRDRPYTFRCAGTSGKPYGLPSPLTRSPPHSTVWTFLSSVLRCDVYNALQQVFAIDEVTEERESGYQLAYYSKYLKKLINPYRIYRIYFVRRPVLYC